MTHDVDTCPGCTECVGSMDPTIMEAEARAARLVWLEERERVKRARRDRMRERLRTNRKDVT